MTSFRSLLPDMRPAAILLATVMITACAVTERPAEPRAGAGYLLPWGAVSLDAPDSPEEAGQKERLMAALQKRVSQAGQAQCEGYCDCQHGGTAAQRHG